MEVLTRCSMCLELYEEEGERIPRILPCHTTVCEGCIKKSLKAGNSFKCPFCVNGTHKASKGKKSFPENEYILAYLGNKVSKFNLCQEHDREMSIFCKNATCKKPICSLCFIEDHNQHLICDIVEEQKVLVDEICGGAESSSHRLQGYKENVESLQKETRDKFVDLEKKIEAQRTKMNELYDNLIKTANDQMEKQTDELGKRANNAEKNVIHLMEIRENVTKDSNYQDLRKKLESVVEVDEKLSEYLTYKYFVFNDDDASNLANNLQGQMLRKEVPRLLSYINCNVIHDLDVKYFCIYFMALCTDNSIVVCGEPYMENKTDRNKDICFLSRLNVQDGKPLRRIKLNSGMRPDGIASVVLEGTNCIALSCRYNETKQIVFYTPGELIEDFNFQPQTNFPGILCAPSPDQLIFTDYYENSRNKTSPLDAKWLDCKTKPPKIVKTLSLRETWVNDICLVHDGIKTNDDVLIGTFGKNPKRLLAFDIGSNTIKWTCDGLPDEEKMFEPYGVTTDQHGHLFVCDQGNACIQIFSVKDGKYLGPLIKSGQQGLGVPRWIRWSKDTKSLIVSHKKVHGSVNISVLKLY